MEHRKKENNIETRNVIYFDGKHRAETRADGDKEKRVIGGLAAVYDKYTDMGWYIEVIKKGFFDGIDTSQTAALKNHDPNLVLGRTANGTLMLKDTPDGLDYEAIVPDTQIGRDTYEEVKNGYIYQSSFAFTAKEVVWREVDRTELAGKIDDTVLDRMAYNGKIDVREMVKGNKLYDVSPVTYPAYADATSEARSAYLKEERSKFITRESDEERMKIKVEVEVEINEPEEIEEPENPGEETPETIETDASVRQQTILNQNRLRVAEAIRAQYHNTIKN